MEIDLGNLVKVRRSQFTDNSTKGLSITNLDLDASPQSREKDITILKEAARALNEQSLHYEASTLLELLESYVEDLDLSFKLIMGECYLSIGKEDQALEHIQAVQKFLLKSPTPATSEVYEMIESMVDAEAHLRALILLPVLNSLYLCDGGNAAVEGMFRCIKIADKCVGSMIKKEGRSRVMAVDFGLKFMNVCLGSMIEIENVDSTKIAHYHCLVSDLMGNIYNCLNDKNNELKVRLNGVEHMEREFHRSANEYCVYSSNYYHIGGCYAELDEYELARDAYEKAIDAVEHATDFATASECMNKLQLYKQKLFQLD